MADTNRDRKLEELLAHRNALVDKLNETLKQVQDNSKEVKHVEGRVRQNENQIQHTDDTLDGLIDEDMDLGGKQHWSENDLEKKVKQNGDQIKHSNDTLDKLQNTIAISEGRHVETVEKMKEVTVLASNIQVQLKEQEQNSNDLNQIRIQV